MTAQYPPPFTEPIDLSATEFWARPLTERRAAFAVLRSREHPGFFTEPETPFAEPGAGNYALVRHADVVEASRNPGVFCSGKGATSIADLPVEFSEYFGSMIKTLLFYWSANQDETVFTDPARFDITRSPTLTSGSARRARISAWAPTSLAVRSR